MARVDVSDEAIEIARETMAGDIRDLALNEIKSAVAWQAFSEEQQRGIIKRVETGALRAVERMVEIMAADGRDALAVKLDAVQIKEGIKATITCGFSEQAMMMLGLHQGETLYLVSKSPAGYEGSRGPVYPEADQRNLPLDGKNHGGKPAAGSNF